MRTLYLTTFAAAALGLTGCGGAKNGPADVAKLTPEQIEAAKNEQKTADDAEKAQRKKDPGVNKKGAANSADDEERRARGGR